MWLPDHFAGIRPGRVLCKLFFGNEIRGLTSASPCPGSVGWLAAGHFMGPREGNRV